MGYRNKIVINKKDLLEMPSKGFISSNISMSTELLIAAKNEGAPILGVICLEPDFDKYNWNHYADETYHYIQWNKK